ncbi:hypothetical protein J4448_00215 [Candidatus Woesearchaeota archaeon]|nr:hypothetical protein [Candidatus Woesearchaeota archaeon]
MKGVISQKHLSLNERLAKESNKLARIFNNQHYSKIKNIDAILFKNNISVEKKKNILIKELHDFIVKTFSIDKRKFGKNGFDSLKKRLHSIRKIIIKLRSINYYLETTFLQGLKIPKIKITSESLRLKQQNSLARDELEALEYTTYKLIKEVVMLDKRLLSEYAHKERKALGKEKIEINDLGLILRKESELLEHLEAKLPPPKAATIDLIKEPIFTHWVARIFALLSYLGHIYAKEAIVFSKIKKNKLARIKISRKISYLMKEKSKLLKIMEEKDMSMKTFNMENKLRNELHNLTTTTSL